MRVWNLKRGIPSLPERCQSRSAIYRRKRAQEWSPHAQEPSPRAQQSIPHAQQSSPRVQRAILRAQESSPHAQRSIPHAHQALPHAQQASPRLQRSIPHVQEVISRLQQPIPPPPLQRAAWWAVSSAMATAPSPPSQIDTKSRQSWQDSGAPRPGPRSTRLAKNRPHRWVGFFTRSSIRT